MNTQLLTIFKKRFYFTVNDVSEALGVKLPSARALCHRYVRNGLFVRLKKNFYTLRENWDHFNQGDFLKLANILQVPSYISFMTALAFYEVTSQVQINFWESACVKRSIKFDISGASFGYYKLNKKWYFDFDRNGDIFIATKEKALLDSLYLLSVGKYRFDWNSLDLDKLDKKKIRRLARIYPPRTQRLVRKLCKI